MMCLGEGRECSVLHSAHVAGLELGDIPMLPRARMEQDRTRVVGVRMMLQ
jgi:hypothetical protein